MIQRFEKYLNGPLGRPVADALEEGSSLQIQTSSHILRVTKENGRLVVRAVGR